MDDARGHFRAKPEASEAAASAGADPQRPSRRRSRSRRREYGEIERQHAEVERQRRNEETRLPEGIDYARVAGLSHEARERLTRCRPDTLGQASRLPGITAATISILLVHLKKRARAA